MDLIDADSMHHHNTDDFRSSHSSRFWSLRWNFFSRLRFSFHCSSEKLLIGKPWVWFSFLVRRQRMGWWLASSSPSSRLHDIKFLIPISHFYLTFVHGSDQVLVWGCNLVTSAAQTSFPDIPLIKPCWNISLCRRVRQSFSSCHSSTLH